MRKLQFIFCLILFACSEKKPISIPELLGDNMVLKQNSEVIIWGKGIRDNKIHIVTNWGAQSEAVVSKNNTWSANLQTPAAGGPYTILIYNNDTAIHLHNIMIGEVWLCAGQSNMEFPFLFADKTKEKLPIINDSIRIFTVPKKLSIETKIDIEEAQWEPATSESIQNTSAIAVYFGAMLQKRLNVPVGIIVSTWGGSKIQSWMSIPSMDTIDFLSEDVNRFLQSGHVIEKQKTAEWHARVKQLDKGYKNGEYIYKRKKFNDRRWMDVSVPPSSVDEQMMHFDGIAWYRKNFELDSISDKEAMISLGPIDDGDMVWINDSLIGQTTNDFMRFRKYKFDASLLQKENNITVRVIDYGGNGGFFGQPQQLFLQIGDQSYSLAGIWKYKTGADSVPTRPILTDPNGLPSIIFNSMINPLKKNKLSGILWYQGESNLNQAEVYDRLMNTLVMDYRNLWSDYNLPFIITQLPNFGEPSYSDNELNLPEFRHAQTKIEDLENTGYVITYDIGDAKNIHPANKFDFANRLFLKSLDLAYHIDTVSHGPKLDSIQIKNRNVIAYFNTNTGKLIFRGDSLTGFVISDSRNRFFPADAILKDNTVILSHRYIWKPEHIRYAWSDNPVGNLYNSYGLPAEPFRTDTLYFKK